MHRAPILFRVDGTSTTGWESFWRCLTFSAALQRRRRQTYFLSQLEPGDLPYAVKRVGNSWLRADYDVGTVDDLNRTIQEIRRLSPAAVILDSAKVTEQYIEVLRAEGPLIVSMDHRADVRFPSQLILNPLLGPSKESYEVNPGSQVLLGSRYSLVRPEIRRTRPLRAQEPAQPFRALVALGDDDPHHQTKELVLQMLNCPRVEHVSVLVRSHHPDLAYFREIAEKKPEQLEVAVEPAEVAAKIVRCHFAITSGDSWSMDLTCVGIPQLVIVQDESHWPCAQRLEEEGCATCLGWYENVSAATIRNAVQNLLDDPNERKSMSRCGRRLIDGRGPDRLVTGLEVMLHSPMRLLLQSAA